MNKYVFAYDTHNLNRDFYDHNDVRTAIINFLLDNGVNATTISEPVDTTIVFKSNLTTTAWHDLINNQLIPAMQRMMDDLYYYFASIKKGDQDRFYNYIHPNPTLQDNFRDLVNEILAERRNR